MSADPDWPVLIGLFLIALVFYTAFGVYWFWDRKRAWEEREMDDEPEETTPDADSKPESQEKTTSV